MKNLKKAEWSFSPLQKDDDINLDSFIKSSPEIDFQKLQSIEENYKYPFHKWFNKSNQKISIGPSSIFISLIDVCCFFGSLKCFKYLLLNKCEIANKIEVKNKDQHIPLHYPWSFSSCSISY